MRGFYTFYIEKIIQEFQETRKEIERKNNRKLESKVSFLSFLFVCSGQKNIILTFKH
jgi:hypothetical protein